MRFLDRHDFIHDSVFLLSVGLTGWFYRADFETIPEDYAQSF
jgi:hypothetical protein